MTGYHNPLGEEMERYLDLIQKAGRYADDLIILCKSKRSARRTLEKIIPFIEYKLFLKANKDKTVVEYVGKVKFIGFTFYQYKGVQTLGIYKQKAWEFANTRKG